jgi:hypothetical protein
MAVEKSGSSENNGESAKVPPGAWLAIGAAVPVVVAILAALGIQEDLLRRMVRNDPDGTAWAIGFVIVGASVPVILVLVPLIRGHRLLKAGLTALVLITSAGQASTRGICRGCPCLR